MSAIKDRVKGLLRLSERYTKTDMVYLVGNGTWLGIAQVGMGLIALGLSIAFAHFVPKDVYGNYRFLLSIFWVLTAFSLTGIATALMRSVARGEEGIYRSVFRTSILWSLPMALLGLGAAGYYFLNENSTLGWGLIAIACIGPLMQSAYLFGAFQEGRRAFKENALSGLVLNGVPALVLLCVMPFFHEPALFIAIYLGANVLTGYAISWFFIWRRNIAEQKMSEEFKNLTGHFSLLNILGTISQQIDRILVFHFLGAVELAVYALAVALPEQIKAAVGSIENLAFSKFANRTAQQVLGNFWNRMLILTGGLVLVAVAYMLVAPYIFSVLFPKYPEAVIYSEVFALSLVFLGNVLPPTIFQAQAAKKELYIFSVTTSVFQIVILIPCILSWGLMGAVIARILARGFNLLFGAILVSSYSKRMKEGSPPSLST
jgi:O-antigen/teichoic acid export membrane protein